MIELCEFVLRVSVISLGLIFLRRLRKSICMAMAITSAAASKQSSSGTPPATWLSSFFVEKGASFKQFGGSKRQKIIGNNIKDQELDRKKKSSDHGPHQLAVSEINKPIHEACEEYLSPSENHGSVTLEDPAVVKSSAIKNPFEKKQSTILKKRPAQLIVPAYCPASDFGQVGKILERKEFQTEGKGFAMASKKGRREIMEDGHGVMLDISGNPKQAFFVVIDGHGGRAAADFVAENLGRNIMNEIQLLGNDGNRIEAAVRKGYSVTDEQFLNRKVNGGACAASVLVKDGELHVANVGDCKVILSRKGVATALTKDHRLTREDERIRIEKSGGLLHCRNGVWRVNGTLAVSRAFGDLYLKDHVISEPDILQLPLTYDCDFLIVASDGLWDKVGDQEAVDVVSSKKDSLESCKELIAMSTSRGGVDDITVMVINLQKFVN